MPAKENAGAGVNATCPAVAFESAGFHTAKCASLLKIAVSSILGCVLCHRAHSVDARLACYLGAL